MSEAKTPPPFSVLTIRKARDAQRRVRELTEAMRQGRKVDIPLVHSAIEDELFGGHHDDHK
jgi:hypothetical protein